MLDDSPSDLMIATKCYERSGLSHPWVTFSDPKQFVDWLKTVIAGEQQPPELILLDINMRGMSGYDVLRWIRSQTGFPGRPYVVMLSNSDARSDAEKSRALGADGFHTKPARLAAYVALLEALADAIPKAGD